MNIIKKYFLTVLPLLMLLCAQCHPPQKASAPNETNLSSVIKHLKSPDENYVLVIAHRGDWRHAPENSILAIKNAIDMGVDIVEIDVQKTKDNILVLMHDKTIDRTTDGSGNVANYTLAELKKLHLKNGLQRPTFHTIPTLEEAMLAAKGKIMVNVDKGYDYFTDVYKVLEKTGTTGQAIMKGSVTRDAFVKAYGTYWDKLFFMPIINAAKDDAEQLLNEYLKGAERIVACEFSSIPSVDVPVIKRFKEIRKSGTRVWMNSLWASQCAGYEDDRAVANPDSIYGWYTKHGVNMIQTDRPALLLSWLRNKKLHD